MRLVEAQKNDDDTRKMITRTARFIMNDEAVPREKIKTCNEEALVLTL